MLSDAQWSLIEVRAASTVGHPGTRPVALRGDKACSSKAIPVHLRFCGIKAVIAEPEDQKGHRRRRGSRGADR